MTTMSTDDEVAWAVIRVSAHWDAARRQAEAGQQLKIADGRLLWLLRDAQPRTLRQIAVELQLEQSTVNRQVNAAIDAGLLTRSRIEPDGAYRLAPSPEGRQKFEADFARQIQLQNHALASIPAHEREQFLRYLSTYVDALNTAAQEQNTSDVS